MKWQSLSKAEKRKRREAKLKRLGEWHRWYAWYPVRVSPTQRAWLESVMRRWAKESKYKHGTHGGYYADAWVYAMPDDVLKELVTVQEGRRE